MTHSSHSDEHNFIEDESNNTTNTIKSNSKILQKRKKKTMALSGWKNLITAREVKLRYGWR
jgi:hypothetical protein